MTSEQIRIQAQLLCGFQIDDITAFEWAKEAAKAIMRSYPLSAKREVVNTGQINAGDTYTLQKELSRIECISKHEKRRNIEQDKYSVDVYGNIKFYVSGNYDIDYTYIPEMPQSKDNEMPIPDRFAECIKYYIASNMRGRVYGHGDAEAQALATSFWGNVADANNSCIAMNKRHRRMPARY